MDEWEGVSLAPFGNAALYGRNPTSPDAQADYFDSLFHSHAVIGLVTSAFLEAAIVGRPVHTLLLPEFEMYQEGVQHFRYLLEVEGGLLEVTRSFPQHLSELAAVLARPAQRDERNVRFITAFVRPGGLESPATPGFVAALEQMAAAAAPAAELPGRWHQAAQPLVARVARSAQQGWLRPFLRDAIEARNDIGKAGKEASRQAARADRARRMADKQRLLERRRQERRREQRAHAQQRHLGRLRGHVRTAARTVASGHAWRKQVARLKGRVKALMGLVS
jgi:hypothetical protein